MKMHANDVNAISDENGDSARNIRRNIERNVARPAINTKLHFITTISLTPSLAPALSLASRAALMEFIFMASFFIIEKFAGLQFVVTMYNTTALISPRLSRIWDRYCHCCIKLYRLCYVQHTYALIISEAKKCAMHSKRSAYIPAV